MARADVTGLVQPLSKPRTCLGHRGRRGATDIVHCWIYQGAYGAKLNGAAEPGPAKATHTHTQDMTKITHTYTIMKTTVILEVHDINSWEH